MNNVNNIPVVAETANKRGVDTYIHANHKGTGSAVRFMLHPAQGDKPGAVVMEIAMQSSIGGFNGAEVIPPAFDWLHKIVVRFDRDDLIELLRVLKGYSESAGNSKGIYHRNAYGNMVIKLAHIVEPHQGYKLSVSLKTVDGKLHNMWFVFDTNEAFGLAMVFEQAMLYVCYGVPQAD